jgi:nicotinamide mononucleotide (NMN) deamidase PncC
MLARAPTRLELKQDDMKEYDEVKEARAALKIARQMQQRQGAAAAAAGGGGAGADAGATMPPRTTAQRIGLIK